MEVGLIGSDHEICGCMIGIEIVFFFFLETFSLFWNILGRLEGI